MLKNNNKKIINKISERTLKIQQYKRTFPPQVKKFV